MSGIEFFTKNQKRLISVRYSSQVLTMAAFTLTERAHLLTTLTITHNPILLSKKEPLCCFFLYVSVPWLTSVSLTPPPPRPPHPYPFRTSTTRA